jgi:hypothetical protein
LFNVPTGGVYANTSLYVFFWADHCVKPDTLDPSPSDPLALPKKQKKNDCPETTSLNSIGISVLGQSAGMSDVAFNQPKVGGSVVTMPSGFVYVNAVDATHAPNFAPSSQQLGVFITGVPRYRASIPYLAYSTTANLGDPSQWMFFNGLSGGTPNWVSYSTWESNHNAGGRWVPPSGAAMYSATTAEQCVGEHSLTWNAPLNTWLLLYNCRIGGVPTIEARQAPAPWGPWSNPIVLLSPAHDPGIYCTLIMSPSGCPGLTNSWSTPKTGGLYGPFVMSRFTQDAAPPLPEVAQRATIYWLVSTWNPYVVVVMQSTLQIGATHIARPHCGSTPSGYNTCQ